MALNFEAVFGTGDLAGGPCHYAFAARRGIIVWFGSMWIDSIKPFYLHS